MLGTGLERFTIRYLVGDEGLTTLVRALLVRMQPDPQGDAAGRYRVTTLYCETPDETHGWPRRRLRARLVDGLRGARTFVEICHHVGRRSWKVRSASNPAEATAACRGEASEHAPALVREGAALARELGLAPTCLVTADRRGFLGGADEPDLRVTIDSQVRHRMADLSLRPDDPGPWQPTLPPGMHLVEVRVARAVPGWLLGLLDRSGCREHAPAARQLARRAV